MKALFYIVGGRVTVYGNFGSPYKEKIILLARWLSHSDQRGFLLFHFLQLKLVPLDEDIISIVLVTAQLVIAAKWKDCEPFSLKN